MASIRNVLITGASSGIGREMAVWWARKGCRVYAAARRLDRLEALAAEIPGRIEPVILDVSDTTAVVDRVRAVDRACGGLDAVVANAGVSEHAPADLAGWEPVERVLRVNVMGAAATLSAVAPAMAARGRGHLAGVSSAAGHVPLGVNGAYAASKAFLSMFARSMRIDMAGTGVSVTLVEPGFVRSEMTARSRFTPWIVNADRAADRFCRAIERGDRLVRYPKIHSAATIVAGHLPAWALERIGRRTMESRRREYLRQEYLKQD